MSTKQIPVNGTLFRQRMLERGISNRDLAMRTRLGVSPIRSITTRNCIGTIASLADIGPCLRELGMSYGEFLDVEDVEDVDGDDPGVSDAADVAHIFQLLALERRGTTADELAVAFDWTVDRVRRALDGLGCITADLGVRVTMAGNRYALNPTDSGADEAHGRLEAFRDHGLGLQTRAAKTLHAVLTGSLSDKNMGPDTLRELGALRRRGAVDFNPGSAGPLVLTAQTAFAFDVD